MIALWFSVYRVYNIPRSVKRQENKKALCITFIAATFPSLIQCHVRNSKITQLLGSLQQAELSSKHME